VQPNITAVLVAANAAELDYHVFSRDSEELSKKRLQSGKMGNCSVGLLGNQLEITGRESIHCAFSV
jgi:hypothetical protein